MTVYTLALPKGGTGRTTTAAELVAHLAASGRRVLAIDLDQQGNLSHRLGFTSDTEVNGTPTSRFATNATKITKQKLRTNTTKWTCWTNLTFPTFGRKCPEGSDIAYKKLIRRSRLI